MSTPQAEDGAALLATGLDVYQCTPVQVTLEALFLELIHTRPEPADADSL